MKFTFVYIKTNTLPIFKNLTYLISLKCNIQQSLEEIIDIFNFLNVENFPLIIYIEYLFL